MRLKQLNEDFEIDNQPTDSEKSIGLSTMINELIADELEAIDGYNSAIVTFEAENKPEYMKVFKDILAEEQVHIGQLQKVLNELTPNSIDNMDKGQQEAEEQINTQEIELAEKEFPLDESLEKAKYLVMSIDDIKDYPENEILECKFDTFGEAFDCAISIMDGYVANDLPVDQDPGTYIVKLTDDKAEVVWNSNYGIGNYSTDNPFGYAKDNLEEDYYLGDEKILDKESDEYEKLQYVAQILSETSPNNYTYVVDDTYLDFDEDLKWTTIILKDKNVQILSPKDWRDILNCKNDEELNTVISDMKADEYWQDEEDI